MHGSNFQTKKSFVKPYYNCVLLRILDLIVSLWLCIEIGILNFPCFFSYSATLTKRENLYKCERMMPVEDVC